MRIVALKRFEFCVGRSGWKANGHNGMTGSNFILWVGVSGNLSADTGMIINLSELKHIVGPVLQKYDHHNLDEYFPPQVGTAKILAKSIFKEIRATLPRSIELESVELLEEGGLGVVVNGGDARSVAHGSLWREGKNDFHFISEKSLLETANEKTPISWQVECHWEGDTCSDSLFSAQMENLDLSPDAWRKMVRALVEMNDGMISARVWSTPASFWEFDKATGCTSLGRRKRFNAAHSLQIDPPGRNRNDCLSHKGDKLPHGHSYFLEVKLRTKGATELAAQSLETGLTALIKQLDSHYLNEDIDWFRNDLPTGENLLASICARLKNLLGDDLAEVRLWETPNNQFLCVL